MVCISDGRRENNRLAETFRPCQETNGLAAMNFALFRLATRWPALPTTAQELVVEPV
jgi:hypothetical protein